MASSKARLYVVRISIWVDRVPVLYSYAPAHQPAAGVMLADVPRQPSSVATNDPVLIVKSPGLIRGTEAWAGAGSVAASLIFSQIFTSSCSRAAPRRLDSGFDGSLTA